jgi:hypothetical protein
LQRNAGARAVDVPFVCGACCHSQFSVFSLVEHPPQGSFARHATPVLSLPANGKGMSPFVLPKSFQSALISSYDFAASAAHRQYVRV